ncbi:LacI family transcriptional regulator [Paenibacillus marchantiophytorum]|uniref:LacI family transcriptional regulator n=1 Tax=Paenibacillus marchantiophytorum TaxID=1619310 RepID=A0ABQ1EXS1_9BACL|nr:LacI family DNA-binding transcriptional regulator [Paenibacillus marchantiophytorum]GFZ91987.1 LacI family transcriptional regulator [Paenibacillus marchantiophytorum]
MKMEDIAKLAGVSKSAVSFALSGKPGISNKTRERVLEIARENGYTPKPRLSGIEGSVKSLSFLVFTNSGIVLEEYYQQPFFRELIHFIEERCRAKGYSLLFSTINMANFDQEIVTFAEDNQSDGVILLGTNLTPIDISEIAKRLGPSLVVLDNCFDTLPVHFVGINNRMGAYQAGSHLCQLGHREIGYIASNVNLHNFEDRKDGFQEALKKYDIQILPEHHFSVAPTMLSSQEDLKTQIKAYLATGRPLPTALFCECDYIAISAMKTLTELGIRIPEDVSIIGFDNITESQIISPELTTVHVEKQRMAQLAVDLVIESIEVGQEITSKIRVDTLFVERHSSVTYKQ